MNNLTTCLHKRKSAVNATNAQKNKGCNTKI